MDAKDTGSYYNRGLAYEQKAEYDRAIADYSSAIRLNPDFADAYNSRGSAYGHKQDFDKAIADFIVAIRLDPKDSRQSTLTAVWPTRSKSPRTRRQSPTSARLCDWTRQELDAYQELPHAAVYELTSEGEHDKAIADYDA